MTPMNQVNVAGSYVPPAAGCMGAPPIATTSGMPYAGDQMQMGQYGPMPGAPVAQKSGGPNLMMTAGLAIGGYLVFGPVGAIVGGLIGLMLK